MYLSSGSEYETNVSEGDRDGGGVSEGDHGGGVSEGDHDGRVTVITMVVWLVWWWC